MPYKVIFHEGEVIALATKVHVGRLSLENRLLSIEGESSICIPQESIQSVELFRHHNTGRMLKIDHSGGVLFVSVVRFVLFGYLAVGNFFANGRLKNELQGIITNRPCH